MRLSLTPFSQKEGGITPFLATLILTANNMPNERVLEGRAFAVAYGGTKKSKIPLTLSLRVQRGETPPKAEAELQYL